MNIYAHSIASQPTSYQMLTTAYDIMSPSGVRQSTPQSATVVTTPPVCAGVTGTVAHLDGSIEVNWAAATGINAPFEYELFVALGVVSGSSLFQNSNLVTIAPAGASSKRILTLADQSTYFVKGSTYSIGVRSKDAFANTDSNTVVSTVVALASGDLPSVYQTIATNIQATEVLLANDEVAIHQDHLGLVANLSTMATELASFHSENVSYAADLVTMAGYLSQFSSDLGNMGTNNLDMSGYLTTLSGYLTNLSDSLTLLSNENADFASSNTAFVGSLSVMNGYLTTLNGYLGSLSALLSTLNSLNTTYGSHNSDLSAQVLIISNSASSIDSSATIIVGVVSDLQAATTSVEASAVSIEASNVGLATSIVTLGNQLVTLNGDLITFSNYLIELGLDVTEINSIIANLNTISSVLVSAVVPAAITGLVEGEIIIEGTVSSEEII